MKKETLKDRTLAETEYNILFSIEQRLRDIGREHKSLRDEYEKLRIKRQKQLLKLK